MRLQRARRAKELTQVELAEETNYSQWFIGRRERGEVEITPIEAEILAPAVDLSVPELLLGRSTIKGVDKEENPEKASLLRKCFRKLRGMGYKEFGEYKEEIMLNRNERAIYFISALGLISSWFTVLSGLPEYIYFMASTVVYFVILLFAIQLRALFRQERVYVKKVRKSSKH